MQIILFLCLALIAGSAACGVYKWVDEEGVVHYTDRDKEHSQELRIPGHDTPAESPAYSLFEFVTPEDDQVFPEGTTEVPVGILLKPALREGHRIRLSLDGNPISEAITSTQVTLQRVEPGSHSLVASILAPDGTVLMSTPPVNFHLPEMTSEPSSVP